MAKKMGAKNSGTVRQRPDGRWEARATIQGKRRSFYADRQNDALKAMRAAQKAADDVVYLEPTRLTVSVWLDTWLREYAANTCKPLTLSTYQSRINSHIRPALGKVKLHDLTPAHIQAFYNDLTRNKELAPKTVVSIHGILHKCLQQAVKLRYIAYNPADACDTPRLAQREIHPFTEDEIGAFLTELDESGEPYARLFRVALFTGMREGEICGLSWDCVDFVQGTITIRQQLQKEKKKGGSFYIATTKNDKTRTITAAPYVIDQLREEYAEQRKNRLAAGLLWENPWNLVFTNPLGAHIVPQTALKRFKAVCSQIGRPDARFHDMRHTYAVASLQEGDNVKTVQENLGHATASFTLDVYGHVSEKMKKDSADRMEGFIQKIHA